MSIHNEPVAGECIQSEVLGVNIKVDCLTHLEASRAIVRVLCDILQRIQCSIFYYYYYFNKDVLGGVKNNNKICRVDLELAASILKDQPEYISNVLSFIFYNTGSKKESNFE